MRSVRLPSSRSVEKVFRPFNTPPEGANDNLSRQEAADRFPDQAGRVRYYFCHIFVLSSMHFFFLFSPPPFFYLNALHIVVQFMFEALKIADSY